jgi:hypothetical protein
MVVIADMFGDTLHSNHYDAFTLIGDVLELRDTKSFRGEIWRVLA